MFHGIQLGYRFSSVRGGETIGKDGVAALVWLYSRLKESETPSYLPDRFPKRSGMSPSAVRQAVKRSVHHFLELVIGHFDDPAPVGRQTTDSHRGDVIAEGPCRLPIDR